jgi:hypothetical protein
MCRDQIEINYFPSDFSDLLGNSPQEGVAEACYLPGNCSSDRIRRALAAGSAISAVLSRRRQPRRKSRSLAGGICGRRIGSNGRRKPGSRSPRTRRGLSLFPVRNHLPSEPVWPLRYPLRRQGDPAAPDRPANVSDAGFPSSWVPIALRYATTLDARGLPTSTSGAWLGHPLC